MPELDPLSVMIGIVIGLAIAGGIFAAFSVSEGRPNKKRK